MRRGLTGDAVRKQKSTQRRNWASASAVHKDAVFCKLFHAEIRANQVPGLKSFILLPVHSSDCTISVALQLLFRPGTTLPALPNFALSRPGSMQ